MKVFCAEFLNVTRQNRTLFNWLVLSLIKSEHYIFYRSKTDITVVIQIRLPSVDNEKTHIVNASEYWYFFHFIEEQICDQVKWNSRQNSIISCSPKISIISAHWLVRVDNFLSVASQMILILFSDKHAKIKQNFEIEAWC